ncbi:hypothetical protein PG988_004717 [Apiospora saccharicola]
MSLFISPTDELSSDAEARRSALRALLEARDPNLRHYIVYKELKDNAVRTVQEDLMKWSRSCLLKQERVNDINAEWYHWRVDRTMFHLVVEGEEFPYEDAMPKGSHMRPHSLEWATYWRDQVNRYSKTLDQTVVGDHRDNPIKVQADGIPVADDNAGISDDAQTDMTGMPSMARSVQAPRQVQWVCANCGERGHTLGDCVVPILDGCDIAGCPICNTKEHLFDQCHNLEYLNAESVLNILYFRRGGKCQIRSDREIFVLFKQYVEHLESLGHDTSEDLDAACPWTRAFTFEFLHKPDCAQKFQGYGGYGSSVHQPLEEDPTVTQEDIMAGKVSSAYSSYQQKKVGAAFATYIKNKNA